MPLLRGIARTAAIAGTATAVSNRVSRRQQNRWAQQEDQQYAQQQPQYAPPPPQAAPPARDTVAQLKDLAELKSQGILTDADFRDADDIVIPVVIYSAHGADQLCDAQIQAALSKSQTPIDILLRTVLSHLSPPILGANAA